MEERIKIDFLLLKKTAIILRALNHQLRQQIFKLLDEKAKLTVTDIYESLKLEQSVASQHLAILRRAGIVKTEREGKFVFYRLNYDRIAQIDRSIKDLL
ncbi:MAG: metalloregulator ArsR/SmtB family transcription factor [Chitinophagaceae bacterium]